MKNIPSFKASVFNRVFFSVLFAPALLAGFLLAPSVSASTYSKLITQSSGPACEYVNKTYGEKIFGQSFLSTSTNITAIALKISRMDANSVISEIRICEGNFSNSNIYSSAAPDWNCDQAGQKPLITFKPDSSIIPIGYSPNWVDFDLPFPILPQVNKQHFVLFKMVNMNICIQNYRDYPPGQSRTDGLNANDLVFNVYHTLDSIDWSVAIPDKTSDLHQDDYYSSGYSVKLNWSTPNTYQQVGTSTYEIEYWPKVYNCQTDYGFNGVPGSKRQTGQYITGPGQRSNALIKDLNKSTSYCFALRSSNQYNQSDISNFLEVNTNDSDLTEDIDQKNDSYPNTININVTQILAQTFVPQKDNLSSLHLLMKSQNSAIGYISEIRLCKGKPASDPRAGVSETDWNCQGADQELIATTSIDRSFFPNESSPLAWVRFPFSSTKKLIPGDDYFFSFLGYQIVVATDFNNENAYPDGWATGANVADLSFRTFYDTGLKGQKRNPVIIVPGIMGSYLRESSTTKEVWLNLGGYSMSGDDEDLRKLKMNNFGKSLGSLYVDNAIEKVFTEDFYNGLIGELEKNGYKEDVDLFIFSYDWRYDIDCLAGVSECLDEGVGNLENKIDWIKTYTGADQVDIIAHSMGGLISKDYMEKFGTSSVGKLITIATPHFGSPKSSKILLYGDNLDVELFGVKLLNEITIKEISQNIPSIYQLLPSQEYFNLSGSYMADLHDADNNGVKGNLNYVETTNFLANTGRNRYLLDKAVALHNKIDGYKFKNSYSISGCGIPTIDKVYIINEEKSGEYEYGIRYTSGDGTVPLKSAENFGAERYNAYQTEHGKISSANGVKQLVAAILQDKQSEFDYHEHYNVSPVTGDCLFSGVQIDYHSPITLSAYDEYGNHVGRTEGGDIEINIPGAQYDEIDGNKFIFLPIGGNYTVTGQATANGSFNARVQKVENGQYVEELYFNEMPLVENSTKVEMAIGDNQESYVIRVDQNGDGIIDEQKTPDSVLIGEEINDLVKPVTSVSISGQLGDNGYYVSEAKIGLSANDDNSGVLKTEYSLDNGQSWTKYEGEFTISQNGTTTILYSSTDRAGNREENKTEVIKIDTEKPEIVILLPQENQEIEHGGQLKVEYLANDQYSGLTDSIEVYFDGQKLVGDSIDLFNYLIGKHQVKIKVVDLAGNYSEKENNFQIITTTDSTIADIKRLFAEKEINNKKVKDDLISDLNWIEKYIEKNAKKEVLRENVKKEIMDKCIAKKGGAWCEERIGKSLDKINYQMDKISQKLLKLKYELILKKIDVYEKIGWLSNRATNTIKDNIKYLISKL